MGSFSFLFSFTELVKASEVVPSRSVARKSTNRKALNPEHLGPVDAAEKPKQYVEQFHPGFYTVCLYASYFRSLKLSIMVLLKDENFTLI